LQGEHDFSSFQAAGCEAAHPVRKLHANSVTRDDDFVTYTCEGTAYLRHMVRNIVGTLVEVGRGERSARAFGELLKAQDRQQAGPTAPSRGLFLVGVKY
jgi:tRNA pseudouridine38-40 synthase